MNCPICNKTIPWYGVGSPPEGPCAPCQRDLPRAIATADEFCEAVFAVGHAIVIRRRKPIPTRDQDGDIRNRLYWSLSWRAPHKHEEKWRMLTFNEDLPLDDWGNLGAEGSVWQRVLARGITVAFDTSWTGSF